MVGRWVKDHQKLSDVIYGRSLIQINKKYLIWWITLSVSMVTGDFLSFGLIHRTRVCERISYEQSKIFFYIFKYAPKILAKRQEFLTKNENFDFTDKVENILKGCLDSIHHLHLQWKFKLWAGEFAWGVKAKH